MKRILGMIIIAGVLLTSGTAVFAEGREPDFMDNHAGYEKAIDWKENEANTGNTVYTENNIENGGCIYWDRNK